MEQAPDPTDMLLNAGSDASLWILVGGPLAIVLAIGVVYALYIVARRRREARAMERDIEAAVNEAGVDESDDGPDLRPKRHLEAVRTPPSATPGPTSAAGTPSSPAPVPLRSVPPLPVPRPAAPVPIESKAPVLPPSAAPTAPPAGQHADVQEIRRTDPGSWRERLARGLTKTRDALRGSMQSLFAQKAKLSTEQLEQLHEALYRADVGVATADKLVDHVRTTIGRDVEADWETVAAALKERARAILAAPQTPLVPSPQPPWVILVVGVNGVGKTTTIGKLAAHFLAADKQVLLAAADTFRAAAIEQLRVWGDRLGVDVVHHKSGSDPAAVAYDGVKAAMARNMDVLMIDTAGRLHSKTELMAELGKINRVIGKDLPGAPHETWLVIDATTGQNAVAQVKAFREVVALTGLVVTKLDGTAKGGVLIGIADQFGLPIRYVGVGEKAADLRAFVAEDYVESLF